VTGRGVRSAEFKTTLRKALIGLPTEATLRSWKAAGFEGVESLAWNKSPKEAAALRQMAEKTGVVIALENVWDNFWVKPALFRHFIASIESWRANPVDPFYRSKPSDLSLASSTALS